MGAKACSGDDLGCLDQCVAGLSSLLLVAKKMDTKKTITMTGTTKNGEV
jgi:hypothetical protein